METKISTETLIKDYETMSLKNLAAANHTSRPRIKAILIAAGIQIRAPYKNISKPAGPYKSTPLPQDYQYLRSAIRTICRTEPCRSVYNRIYQKTSTLGLKKLNAQFWIIADSDIPKLEAELINPKRCNSLIGHRFGRLVVLSTKAGKAKVQCDCGTIKTVHMPNLYKGKVKSCGCLLQEFYASGQSRKRRYPKGQRPTEIKEAAHKAWNQGYVAHIESERRQFVEWAKDLGMTAKEAAEVSTATFAHVVDITSGRQACGVKLVKSIGQNQSFESGIRKLAKSLAKTPYKIWAARKAKYRSWS